MLLGPPTESMKAGVHTIEPKTLPYPRAVFFIFITEFCERFSYYGMRAVLTIYMRNVLNFSESLATTVYHVFLLLCYALPVLGGILADSYAGKYRTILYLSLVYALGNVVLTSSATPPLHLPIVPLSLLGLFLMAVGTGGIKPCVVALGGEQFKVPEQDKQLRQFFSVFLFAVSIGSMLSTVLTPILRRDVHCFGDETCYPLAFGVPGALMIIAIVVFVSGKRMYKIKTPDCNIIVEVVKCISTAVSEKSKRKASGEKKEHWLDYAAPKFSQKLIKDTKGLLRVLVYYLPIPMFFALYEQLGSRWTLQATRMTGYLSSGYSIKPDQMQVANAVLMFLFIPFFEGVVYPVFRKCSLLRRPLQRMGVGGVLAALSFLVAGIVETNIESTYSILHTSGETHLNLMNTLPCPLTIFDPDLEMANGTLLQNSTGQSHGSNLLRLSLQPNSNVIVRSKTESRLNLSIQVNSSCAFGPHGFLSPNSSVKTVKKWSGRLHLLKTGLQSLVISYQNGSLVLNSVPTPETVRKSKEGNALLRLMYVNVPQGNETWTEMMASTVSVKLINDAGNVYTFPLNSSGSSNYSLLRSSWTFELPPNMYQVVVRTKGSAANDTETLGTWIDLLTGGSYVLSIHQNYERLSDLQAQLVTLTEPNHVHMLWLLPQYVLMAWAEVFFIISGMEFSFTEAPASMKSVLQSCWHLTNAVGNAIVIISAQFNLQSTTEFFGFSGLMFLDVVIFCLLAIRYKYVTPDPGTESEPEAIEEESPL